MQRIYTYMIDHLEVDETVIQSDYYGSYYNSTHNNNGSITTESLFDPLLGAEANEMSIHFGSVHLSVTDSLTIPLDTIQEYPYTFEYADSTISIDNVQSKDATEITLSNYETENRSFDSLQYNVATENDAEITSMEMDGEGVIVDKNGKEYDIHNPTIPYEELVHPRHIRTVERTKYYGNNVKPTAIELYGYDSTKYLDDVVKVKINPAE